MTEKVASIPFRALQPVIKEVVYNRLQKATGAEFESTAIKNFETFYVKNDHNQNILKARFELEPTVSGNRYAYYKVSVECDIKNNIPGRTELSDCSYKATSRTDRIVATTKTNDNLALKAAVGVLGVGGSIAVGIVSPPLGGVLASTVLLYGCTEVPSVETHFILIPGEEMEITSSYDMK